MRHIIFILLSIGLISSCSDDDSSTRITIEDNWTREPTNPVFTDFIPEENYEAASDPHVFYVDGELFMVYSGDVNGQQSIKLARGNSYTDWQEGVGIVTEVGPSGLDISKETPFYRRSSSGKHQIYYIGYEDEETYKSQIYLAEADNIEGPYVQSGAVIELGNIANREVRLITSPSVVEHQGSLFIMFIGWNGFRDVTEIWIIGAESIDDGRNWTNFQEVVTPIGAEGQVTKTPDGSFVAVRTGDFEDREAIYYATASAPYGPWNLESEPLLVQMGPPLELDEIIAPQITFDPDTGKEYLYYTGADYSVGWWVMMATRN